ncbi:MULTISPECIES: FdhF/YdeP family oxidoreductase [unclassified Rhizobium]|uniref:FdhF/YdeP family oxidoreductase n=1 Tax=unclassified Rhizobium TaxID=2613769 RepID=UPI001A986431|nr:MULTISPECIES: FdhF/YdeP family oxidoreductase [unclassified Rhizobium]MBX5167814.1 FdhF/YdeP family oxidoreductase [Rhizobium sp. NZLR4b]MBX5186429.1 FdhF/YdeP family oxidoreductase [Rhizobium sp. NZLR5]MBX5198900.1 FdhF/YdeP family oxidoreductase [Rhizobium sp. NZLR10]MBX5205386.1 FdhF/YdeP family oxidoreductase [Rhizobium sp. NZLR1]MBX5211861.1 FdhF/YdeP family oxidoreductase [Rhizobium sp. NZLR11]
MTKKRPKGIETYTAPAGGWGALKAVAETLARQQVIAQGAATLLKANQPEGFDCPGCAWPDPKHTSSFEFCENGAKAITWESTAKRAGPDFFATHGVAELWQWNDHQLEDQGRLTHPLIYDHVSDHYLPIGWDEALALIGDELRKLPDPDMAEFYTSGRASNEAAFLFQLFVRAYGTNNFPDCSNMCHEATSVGLPDSIGVGKGTVTLEDFDHADAIFSFGHNPGTNHPRMMTTLHDAARRGVPIVVFNPLKERALEKFAAPQNPVEMAMMSSTPIASAYHQVRTGGDLAALKGMMKRIFERDDADITAGGKGFLDREFIKAHTIGLEALKADVAQTEWASILRKSGLTFEALDSAVEVYLNARNVILCYGMGITQHSHGTANVQQLANFLMLRGNIGRQGAGICPLRGHSNVQGDRTVGITEIPNRALLDGMEKAFGFRPPEEKGHNAVEAIEAIIEGRSKALVCLGGNLAVAISDPDATFIGMRKLHLAVHIATKLNRSHLLIARTSIIFPVLGRTDQDIQKTGPQSVTVEDSMSMVHASRGFLKPPGDQLRSEPAIIAGIAKATLGSKYDIDWDGMVGDYSRIREKIAVVFPDFHDFNTRVRKPGGFRLTVAAADRQWHTPSGKAHFLTAPGLEEDPRLVDADTLVLTTLRSHDQYNTTIYSLDDRYRGVFGRRDIIFMNSKDLSARGLADGDRVDIESVGETASKSVKGFTAVAYDIPAGSVAGYYPEMNRVIALADYDRKSGTPAYKGVPVKVQKSA